MKKNAMLIEQYKTMKKLEKATKNNVAEIYACFAKVLTESYRITPSEIEELFGRTQELWHKLVEQDEIDNMIDWCEQTTGISLRSEE